MKDKQVENKGEQTQQTRHAVFYEFFKMLSKHEGDHTYR